MVTNGLSDQIERADLRTSKLVISLTQKQPEKEPEHGTVMLKTETRAKTRKSAAES